MTTDVAALTPTDAILAHAAATTPAELHAARMALIEGGGILTYLDPWSLVAGDGSAGDRLLGGAGPRALRLTVASRSLAILRRLEDTPPGGEPL